MIRIAIAVQRFPVASETFIASKIRGLLDAGFDVQIFATEPGAGADQWRDRLHNRLHVAPPLRPSWRVALVGLPRVLITALRHPAAFARFVRHNWRWRRTIPAGWLKGIYTRLHFVGRAVDVLHIEFDSQGLNWADLKHYLGGKLGCKLLLSARGTLQRTSLLDTFPDAPTRLFAQADGYHFISEYLRANARRLGLGPGVRTWLIEPAIDLQLFSLPDAPEAHDNLRVISVGSLVWPKGYEFAIDAIARVRAAGVPVEYAIVGDGPYREAAEFAARQWGLLESGVVQFVGALPREEVAAWLRRADVMLHAAVDEGFCNAVIEAQAAGLPVVCSDAGGLPENVQDGLTGFVVPRRDPPALAEKLILLARDSELRRRMGRAGRERASNRFDLTGQVAAFVQLYRELTGHE